MGHGFYQFSPEFFFRALSAENGYRVRGLFLVPMFTSDDWLLARDPAQAGRRVGFNAPRRSTYLFVIAQRLSPAAIFASDPQQSDYSAEWATGQSRSTTGHRLGGGWKAKILKHAPRAAHRMLTEWRALNAHPDPAVMTRFTPGRDRLPPAVPVDA